MEARGRYKTKQRELVSECLEAHAERYLSVDEVYALLSVEGARIGRTTVYRNLDLLVSEGVALKVASPSGEMRYRKMPKSNAGQLVCLSCGQVYPLECGMLGDFSHHVLERHGFKISPQTVLYGLCSDCVGGSDEEG